MSIDTIFDPASMPPTSSCEGPILTPTEVWDRKVWKDFRATFSVPIRKRLPDAGEFRILTGFPSGKRGGAKTPAVYIAGALTDDGVAHVCVNPMLKDTRTVVFAIHREVIRGVVDTTIRAGSIKNNSTARKQAFQAMLREYGIESGGKGTDTPLPSAELNSRIEKVLADHGPRPWGVVTPTEERKKQPTYMLSGTCPSCGSGHRATTAKLHGEFTSCANNGQHARVFVEFQNLDGTTVDPPAMISSAAWIIDNGNGTFSPAF